MKQEHERRMHLRRIARRGYVAYGDKAEWKAYDGKPMPQWEELPEHIRGKWEAAASAILLEFEQVVKENSEKIVQLLGHMAIR